MTQDPRTGLGSQPIAEALFRPRGVALVGASSDPSKNTARPLRFMRRLGFEGAVYPINPNRPEVMGTPAYPSVAAAPGPVDQAFVMVPARAVPGALEDCAAAGVRVVTVYTDGFAELGDEGRERQSQLVSRASELGLRLIGPNSIGLINLHSGLALTVSATLEAGNYPCGPVSVISQSGTMLGALLSRGSERGVGFSKLVSIGNESDLAVGELVHALVDDSQTEVICLFLETLRSHETLAAAARRAYAAGKPVIAYLLGRSEAGQALAVSHSGALAGSARAAEAFLEANGIIQVEMLESLFEITPLIRGRRPSPGRRVAVITTTGGGAATVADRLGTLGVELVSAPQPVVDFMAGNGVDVSRSPIIDLTMAGARPGVYGEALGYLLADERCDAVVTVVGSSAQHHPEIAVAPIVELGRTAKPVAAFMVPNATRSLEMLAQAGVAAFRTPESCADALNAYLNWKPPVEKPAPVSELVGVEQFVSQRSGTLNEAEGLALFELLGLPVVSFSVVPLRESTSDITEDAHSFPVVAKLLSADLPHKSNVGAVTLNITNEASLREAVETMTARVATEAPTARLDGVLVQTMVSGVGEAIVGFRRDPGAGPIITVGLGGIMTEILADVAVATAPVDKVGAQAMLASIRGFDLLRGARGQPRGDLDALAEVVARVSQLAVLEHILEAEINPVLVGTEGEGVTAVDALVVLFGEDQGRV
jgi:acyl-CoA synthetase (NDP forming)